MIATPPPTPAQCPLPTPRRPRPPTKVVAFSSQNRLTKPEQAGLNQTAREGDTAGGVRGGGEAPRLRGTNWAKATPLDASGRCLERVPSAPITPGPSSSPGPCRSSSPLPPQAAQVPGRQREGAPWSALGSHQGNDTGVRQEGKFPGWKPFLSPPECWTANAPRPPSPAFLSAAKPPSGCKHLEPVPTPSAHQP